MNRSKGFVPLSSDAPDEVDAELYRAGAIKDDADRRRINQALSGPLAKSEAELSDIDKLWADAPPLQLQSGKVLRLHKRPEYRLRSLITLTAAAAALAAFLGAWMYAAPQQQTPSIRSMGQMAVDLVVEREGKNINFTEAGFKEGDRLSINITAPRPGYGTLATLQEDGQIFILARSDEHRPLYTDQGLSPSGLVELDGYSGREWLIFVLDPEYSSAGDVEYRIRSYLPDPSTSRRPDVWVFDLSRR